VRLQTTLAAGETALLGLLDFFPQGEIGGLTFSVDNHGTTLFSRSFSSNAEAWDYFADHPMTLTAVEGNIDLGLHLALTGTLPQSLALNFMVGAIPEVSTQVMVTLAFGGLFVLRRWQARKAAARGAAGRGGAPWPRA
jgi:hypothetical protein